MRYEVSVTVLDNDDNLIWGYTHAQTYAGGEDQQTNALGLASETLDRIDEARRVIARQAATDAPRIEDRE